MNRMLMACAAVPLLALSTVPAFATATNSFFAPHATFNPQPALALALVAIVCLGLLFRRIMTVRSLAMVLFAIAAVSLSLDIAFAAESAPETVAQSVGESAKVTWAWGATVTQWLQAVAWLIGSALLVALRRLPANLIAVFGNARVELLLQNAIGYGINAVAGAVKDKTLTVDVGNKVLAEALQYAIDNAPGWLQSWAGGPEGLAKKIWGRLNLGEGASDAGIPTIVEQVTSNQA